MKTNGGNDKEEERDNSSANNAAGKEFGRGAHKKRHKKDKN